jgi:hypothetical protein
MEAPVQIAVVLKSTTINPVDLGFIVQAWDAQSKDFCAAWSIPYVPVLLYTDLPQAQVGTGEVRVLTIEDTLDVPDAEGYHTDDLGVVFARVLADNNADSGSHECCEESLDPTCEIWKPMGNGSSIAFESCDPVEGDSYMQAATIGDETRQVPVSNFVLPAYFDPNGQAPFDKMGKLTAPFTMDAGGYYVVQDASGNDTDVFAARVVHGGPAGKLAAEKKMARPDSRLSRRLAAKKHVAPSYETQVPMPAKFRPEASSPPMPWGSGPRPDNYIEPEKSSKPEEPTVPPKHAPQFG